MKWPNELRMLRHWGAEHWNWYQLEVGASWGVRSCMEGLGLVEWSVHATIGIVLLTYIRICDPMLASQT